MDFYSCFDSDPQDIDLFCIAIGRPDRSRKQQHIGIYYTSATGDTKFLHQPFHYHALESDPEDKYLWLDVPLDADNKMHMATFCAMVAEENPKGIAYSICHKGTSFTKTGKFHTESQFAGLTCATFVMQIFESQVLPIIDVKNWKHIPSDKDWQNQILQVLVKYGGVEKDSDYYLFQKKRLADGVARFKPEAVAAAAVSPDAPHSPSDILDCSNEILEAAIAHSNKV
ncbi:hypothetical protein [Neptunomonas japonica]|uniref:hypothetical protein n=1 Tax=Neptunomonas japonica TaxID=417574 RepID=UPI000408975B|nr:hypothetical protein [Neptunomonas japonica]